MKNKVFALLAILAVFGLAIATYAYNRNSNTTLAKVSCCKNADSCPMKNKDGGRGKEHAKGEGHTCCGDSCPTKKKGDQAKMSKASMSIDVAAETADGCCCCCTGDSCPMKKKEGEAKATVSSGSEQGKNCCDNCDCCKGKSKTATA